MLLYRERLGKFSGIVGMSLSVGISFWVAHGAFGYFFSMADLKLLKKVHLLPKLSLATRLKEYLIGKNIWKISSVVMDLHRP